MAGLGRPADEVGLSTLMASSTDSRAHMSAAAEGTFLLGVLSLVTAGFSALLGVTIASAGVAVLLGVVGMITTRDRDTAGGALSAVGLFAALAATVVVSLRYLGLDTAYGDAVAPWLWEQLQWLNSRLPQPR